MAAPPSGDLGRSRAIRGDLGRSRAISLSQVVDDEEFVRAVTVCALEAESPGCEVVTAENGEQGIAVYLERRHEEPPQFDLILMDIQMPVLTGDLVILSPHHPPPPAHPHPNHHQNNHLPPTNPNQPRPPRPHHRRSSSCAPSSGSTAGRRPASSRARQTQPTRTRTTTAAAAWTAASQSAATSRNRRHSPEPCDRPLLLLPAPRVQQLHGPAANHARPTRRLSGARRALDQAAAARCVCQGRPLARPLAGTL